VVVGKFVAEVDAFLEAPHPVIESRVTGTAKARSLTVCWRPRLCWCILFVPFIRPSRCPMNVG
jgi:hypothetical protein